MLDRNKIIQEIEKLNTSIFSYDDSQFKTACRTWEDINLSPEFKKQVITSKSSFLLPSWNGKLTDVFQINPEIKDYAVLSVDGSQIYPDRHMSGTNCFLINTGQCHLKYGQTSKATLSSQPHVFIPDNLFSCGYSLHETFTVDLIDLKREELELEVAFNTALNLNKKYSQTNTPFAVFADGSLIFWQLESKQADIKKYFLNRYFQHLNNFYENNIPMAGYISMPKSRELINLLKIGLCRFQTANCITCHSQHETFPCKDVEHVLDTQLCSIFLNQNCRTTIFYSNSKVVDLYPEHLKPCFFYLDIGKEIVRLEFPAWLAQKPEHLDLICKIAIDQVSKGQGYPVVLAEAHEQAVIKGQDRDFFYQLICKKGFEQNQQILFSPKSLKKRNVSI